MSAKNWSLVLLSVMLCTVRLAAETLLESRFTQNASRWYALPQFGEVVHDAAGALLRVKVNASGEARIANWQKLSAADCIGKRIRLSARVHGTGTLTPVFVLTVPSASGGKSYPRRAGQAVTLTGEAAEVEFILDLTGEAPLQVEPRFELKGEGAEACFAAIRCETLPPAAEAARIEAAQDYYPVSEQSPEVTVVFRTDPGLRFQAATFGCADEAKTMLTADADGIAAWRLPAATTARVGKFRVVAAHQGRTAVSWVEVKGLKDFTALAEAAELVKLPAGTHLLALGDSLSDYDRGWNYLNLTESFVNRQHPGTLKISNYAIGGDDIKRVARRFRHAVDPKLPNEVFQKRYRGILEGKYTHILIFLGQNDTKASYTSNFTVTYVPTPEFEQHWRALLDALKEQFPEARLILASPIHINSARQEELSKIILKTKPNVWQFGIDRHVRAYDEVVKKMAQEYHASYLDLYAASSQADPNKLFRADDGLHLAPGGQQFMALELMNSWK